jgi:hypothetical protein
MPLAVLAEELGSAWINRPEEGSAFLAAIGLYFFKGTYI